MGTSQLTQLRDLLSKGGAGLLYLAGESWWERLLSAAYKRPYHLAGFYCPSTARGKQEILVLLYSPSGYVTLTLDELVEDPLVSRLALAPLKDLRMEPAFRSALADIASVRITPKDYIHSLVGCGKLYSRDVFRALESKLGPCIVSLAIPHSQGSLNITLEEYECSLFTEATEVQLPSRSFKSEIQDPLRSLGPLLLEEFFNPTFREAILKHVQPNDDALIQTRCMAAHQRLAGIWGYLDNALQTGVMDLSQLSLLIDKTNQERMQHSLNSLTLHDCPLSNLCLSGTIVVPQCHHVDRIVVSKNEEEYDARLSLIAQIKRLVDDRTSEIIPTLQVNELIRCSNILFGTKIPRIREERSYPCLLVITQAPTRDLQLSLKDGNEVVLPSHHADLSGMTVPQLQEILRFLDAVAECDRRFDTLRLQVADEIGQRTT